MSDDGPKIQIDDDWKAQAQREKERHAGQADPTPTPSGAPSPPPGPASPLAAAGRRELPEASFETLVNLLASQALMYLGAVPDSQGRAYVSPEMARHQIDLLGVLEDKTKDALTDDERSMLGGTLYELRSAYVSVSQMLRDQALGKTDPAGAR